MHILGALALNEMLPLSALICHIFYNLTGLLTDNRKMIIMLFLACFDPQLGVKAAVNPLCKTAITRSVLGKYERYKKQQQRRRHGGGALALSVLNKFRSSES